MSEKIKKIALFFCGSVIIILLLPVSILWNLACGFVMGSYFFLKNSFLYLIKRIRENFEKNKCDNCVHFDSGCKNKEVEKCILDRLTKGYYSLWVKK